MNVYNTCLKRKFKGTHRIRAGIPPDMQEQNTTEKKEKSPGHQSRGQQKHRGEADLFLLSSFFKAVTLMEVNHEGCALTCCSICCHYGRSRSMICQRLESAK